MKRPLESLPSQPPLVSKIAAAIGVEPRLLRPDFEVSGPKGRCYWNVSERVVGEDGAAAYGWRVIWLPNVFIDAQHHAVWERPDGQLVDVTPLGGSVVQPSRSSFLRDDKVIPNFHERPPRIPNVILNICGDSIVDEYIAIAGRIVAEEAVIDRNASVLTAEYRRLTSLFDQLKARLVFEVYPRFNR